MTGLNATAEVESAAPADRSTVVADLHTAFMEDPVLQWVFPSDRVRRRYGRAFFDMQARRLLPLGLAWRAPGAAALWAPAGRWRESPLDTLRLAVACARGTGRRSSLVSRGLLALESRHPKSSHLYLATVGVAAPQRGQGLGRRLLEPGLSRADALALPAYLESSNPRNLTLYERLGFTTTAEHRLPRGPLVTLMWRRAHAEG